jgi:hypothetical protein
MSDLHEMLLVLMNYERTETVKARRDVVRNIMEALVEREKLLTEIKILSYLESEMKKENSDILTITLDCVFKNIAHVTVNLGDGKEKGERGFSSDQSLLDALAQCVHSLKNEKPRT